MSGIHSPVQNISPIHSDLWVCVVIQQCFRGCNMLGASLEDQRNQVQRRPGLESRCIWLHTLLEQKFCYVRTAEPCCCVKWSPPSLLNCKSFITMDAPKRAGHQLRLQIA